MKQNGRIFKTEKYKSRQPKYLSYFVFFIHVNWTGLNNKLRFKKISISNLWKLYSQKTDSDNNAHLRDKKCVILINLYLLKYTVKCT